MAFSLVTTFVTGVALVTAAPYQTPHPIIAANHCCILAIEETPETLVCNNVDCYPPSTSGCTAQGRTASSFIVGGICKFAPEEICKMAWVSTQLDIYRCNTDFTTCVTPLRRCSWEYNNAGEVQGHYQCQEDSSVCGLP